MTVSIKVDHEKKTTLFINTVFWETDDTNPLVILRNGDYVFTLPTNKDIHGQQLVGITLIRFIHLLLEGNVIHADGNPNPNELRMAMFELGLGDIDKQVEYFQIPFAENYTHVVPDNVFISLFVQHRGGFKIQQKERKPDGVLVTSEQVFPPIKDKACSIYDFLEQRAKEKDTDTQ